MTRARFVNENYRRTKLDKAMAWAISLLAYEFPGYSAAYNLGDRVVLYISPQGGDDEAGVFDFEKNELVKHWRTHSTESNLLDDDESLDWLYDHASGGAFTGLPTNEEEE